MSALRPNVLQQLQSAPLDRALWYAVHEAWEARWMTSVPHSPMWYGLRGLIQLSAAGVKLCDGCEAGVAKLLARAQENLARCLDQADIAPLQRLCNATGDDAERIARTLCTELLRLQRRVGERCPA